MPFLYVVLQLVLVVCWYTVPAMATIPAAIIFIPTIMVGIGIVLWLLILVAVFSAMK